MLMTTTQINKLGERLRKGDSPSEDDLISYQLMSDRYQVPLNTAVEALERCGFVVTTRFPKTAGTLVEKLKRDRSRLSKVQDIAGARIVIDGWRDAQDAAVTCLLSELEGSAECEVVDRREQPSAGYRAVHVIVRVDGIPVEVQVRTTLQDGWANIMEKFADLYGRQVRYGERPTDPDQPLERRPDLTAGELHTIILEMSDVIDDIEDARALLEHEWSVHEASEVLDAFDVERPDDDLSVQALASQVVDDRMTGFESRLKRLMSDLENIFESVGA